MQGVKEAWSFLIAQDKNEAQAPSVLSKILVSLAQVEIAKAHCWLNSTRPSELQIEILWTSTGVLLLNNGDAPKNLLFPAAFHLTGGGSAPAKVLFLLLL